MTSLQEIARQAAENSFEALDDFNAPPVVVLHNVLTTVADAVTLAVLQEVRRQIDAEGVAESDYDEGHIHALEVVDALLGVPVRPEQDALDFRLQVDVRQAYKHHHATIDTRGSIVLYEQVVNLLSRSDQPQLRAGEADPRVDQVTESDPADAGFTKRFTGLYNKFHVTRTDGKSEPGQKHEDCDYFVLDVTHDKHAYAALRAYAASCEPEYPALAQDLRVKAQLMTIGPSQFFMKPEPAIVDQVLIDRVGEIVVVPQVGSAPPAAQEQNIGASDDPLVDARGASVQMSELGRAVHTDPLASSRQFTASGVMWSTPHDPVEPVSDSAPKQKE